MVIFALTLTTDLKEHPIVKGYPELGDVHTVGLFDNIKDIADILEDKFMYGDSYRFAIVEMFTIGANPYENYKRIIFSCTEPCIVEEPFFLKNISGIALS